MRSIISCDFLRPISSSDFRVFRVRASDDLPSCFSSFHYETRVEALNASQHLRRLGDRGLFDQRDLGSAIH
jgi:hypothetical protein